MVIQTLLKMIIDLTMHQETENYEHVMGSHVLEREVNSCYKEISCKELFRRRLQLG